MVNSNLSKGIPSDIDLTMNGVFRSGVGEILTFCTYTPGILPWDSEGRVKNNKHDRVHYWRYDDQNQLFQTIEVMFNDFTSVDDDMQFNFENRISNWSLTYHSNSSDSFESTVYKRSARKIITIEDISELEKYAETYKLSIIGGKVLGDLTKPKRVFDYGDSAWYNTKIYNYSFSSNSTNTIKISNTSPYFDSFDGIPAHDIELVLKGCERAYLSKKELDGESLIYGTADEVASKIRKLLFVEEARRLIKETEPRKKIETHICHHCGKEVPIGYFGYSSYDKYCAECALELFMKMKTPDKLDTLGTARWTDFDSINMRGDGFKQFDLEDDQWYEQFDTIDFFRPTRYSDRGRFLVQIPRGSHELDVDFDTGRMMDEEEPDSNRYRNKPDMLFGPEEKSSYRLYEIHSINRLINRA